MDKRVIKRIVDYYIFELKRDKYSREHSWSICYNCFCKARKNPITDEAIDSLSLQLAFYLASWGMYRGSSFLLQESYLIHRPVVEIILSTDYNDLLNLSYNNLFDKDICDKIVSLYDSIGSYYIIIRNNVKGRYIKADISEILITKILLGTLGCVPAYDECFTRAIKKQKVSSGKYCVESLKDLARFYMNHHDILEKERNRLNEYGVDYPQMKFLDMIFWKMGNDYAFTN